MKLNPEIKYTGGKRGWIGDNPLIHLDNSKIIKSGMAPKLSIKQGVIKTVDYLDDNPWLFNE